MEKIINDLLVLLSNSSYNINNLLTDTTKEELINEDYKYHILNILNHKKQIFPKDFIWTNFSNNPNLENYNKDIEESFLRIKDTINDDLWMAIGVSNRKIGHNYNRFHTDYDIVIDISESLIDKKNQELLGIVFDLNTFWPYSFFVNNLIGKFSKIILDLSVIKNIDTFYKESICFKDLLSINGIFYIIIDNSGGNALVKLKTADIYNFIENVFDTKIQFKLKWKNIKVIQNDFPIIIGNYKINLHMDNLDLYPVNDHLSFGKNKKPYFSIKRIS